jgi:protein SCO1
VKIAAAMLGALLAPSIAWAALPQAALDSTGIVLSSDARFPLSLSAPDLTGKSTSLGQALGGRAGFVLFADYTCKTLCGPALALLGAALDRSGEMPVPHPIIVIGLDPKDRPADAERMRDSELAKPLRANAVFLLPDSTTLARAAAAGGFRYVYDKSVDQFAHPEAVYVVAADGRILRLLAPFALTTADMSSVFAAPAQHSGMAAALRTICYRFGILRGPYSEAVATALKIAAGLTMLAMAAGLLLLTRGRAPR